MNDHSWQEEQRFGSARFADTSDLRRAGLFSQGKDALLIGFDGNRPIYWNGAGGLLLTAGARSGKLRDVLGYNVCDGVYGGSMVVLDMKGELAAISQNQTRSGKHRIDWNPCGLHGLPSKRINPCGHLRIDSPSLVSDMKVFCENLIATSGNPKAEYFEGRARELLEGIALTIARLDGVVTFPRLYRFINLIPGNSDAWINFAFEMSESGFPVAVRVEQEIAEARTKSSGGMPDVLGELLKAVACLSDPVLMASISPPFDWDIADLTDGDTSWHFHMILPAEFVGSWAAILKSFFVSAMTYKARAPLAPRQTWVLDECAQLGGFPLVTKLFTYGAGIGIRPWAVFQSTDQMKAIGPHADTIITSSAAVRSYFGIRDYTSASTISHMIGAQTLDYDDELQQARARLAKQEAAKALLAGGDPFELGMQLAHHGRASIHRAKQRRLLIEPDEVLNMSADKQIIFADGVDAPIFAGRKPYYEQRFMAGRFHPNPYHPPLDRVRIKTRLGHAWRQVKTEPVSPEVACYPQYSDGTWSYIEGFK